MQKLKGVLSYLDSWREEANQRDGMKQEEKNRLCISQQTDDSWHITNNFLKSLLRIYVFDCCKKYVSNRRFSFFVW